MLVQTGHGSISFVAGCCWVNSVAQPTAVSAPRDEKTDQPFQWRSWFKRASDSH